MKLTEKQIERFWANVLKQENKSDCWIWTGYKNKRGWYGHMGVGKKYQQAHRISWVIHFGEIPKGLCVLHHCDNPQCTNPSHLFLGTHTDNMKDKVSKGRAKTGNHKGELNQGAKLTEDQVRFIRSQPPVRGIQRRMAEKFNVTETLISRIVLRKSWKHVA